MSTFEGFSGGKHRFISIPAQFFSELLPAIDDLDEMRVTLAAFWRLDRMEGNFRYLLKADFLEDEPFMKLLGSPDALERALEKTTTRGTFLKACVIAEGKQVDLYFLNTPRGRAAVEAIRKGSWRHTGNLRQPLELVPERPNIYRLYEENIGPLTPMIADMLRDAEETYPEAWITSALKIALANNVRRWRYVEAILRSWKEEGRDERKDRQDSEEDFRRYTTGKFAEFINS
jgi:DnaD/phage-associated family protein